MRPRYPTVRRVLPLFAGVLVACTSAAEPPPQDAEITAWAAAADVTLSPPRTCTGIEEHHFGSLGSVCWSAKARQEQPPTGSRMFPRFDITIARYADDATATARIARFHEGVTSMNGEAGKTYPLRAGFRLGSRVVIVTTDALAFEADTYRATAALATATGGTQLVCWTPCP